MAENSGIEWTDHTFNPWMGCTKVSPACKNCYAERDFDHRYKKVNWGPSGDRRKTAVANWRKPLQWNRQAEQESTRLRVFCASLADVFEDWQGPILNHNGEQLTNATMETAASNSRPLSMDDLRSDLFDLIDATPHLDWLLLTKRPENIRRMWKPRPVKDGAMDDGFKRLNVWLGTSVENQEWYDERIEDLNSCKSLCENLFLSCEPLVGRVELSPGFPVDWVITGGESGPAARPAHSSWYRELRDQCLSMNIPFHFKQWGEFYPIRGTGRPSRDEDEFDGVWHWVDRDGNTSKSGCEPDEVHIRIGKKKAGRILDGETHDGLPCVTASV